MPFRYDFFFPYFFFNSFGDIPVRTGSGICHKTHIKKMGWAGLAWAATLSSETAPRWLCPKNPFPKKAKKLLAFGFVWLEIITHHTSHTINTCHLLYVAIRHRHRHRHRNPYQNCERATHLMSQLQPLEMLKCEKVFLSLSLSVVQAQAQVQKTWFIEEALYLELESSLKPKSESESDETMNGRMFGKCREPALITHDLKTEV